MGLLIWLVLGLIAGWLASVIMKSSASNGMLTDIILGIVGSFVGGFIMNLLGYGGVNGLNLYSVIVATFGAIVLIALGRMFMRGV